MEVLAWIAIAFITGLAASSRNRSGIAWFFLGMLFSIFALIAVLVMGRAPSDEFKPEPISPRTHVKCPDCAELILAEARVCKHCGAKVQPSS